MDQPGAGPAPVERHLQRVEDEFGSHVIGHRPADDPPRERVLDGGEIEPALPGAQVGDVGHPQHVRCGGAKLAPDEVVGDADARHPDRRAVALARDQPGDLALTHEPLDALARDHDAVTHAQFGGHPARSVDPPVVGVDLLDALQQPRVGEVAI